MFFRETFWFQVLKFQVSSFRLHVVGRLNYLEHETCNLERQEGMYNSETIIVHLQTHKEIPGILGKSVVPDLDMQMWSCRNLARISTKCNSIPISYAITDPL